MLRRLFEKMALRIYLSGKAQFKALDAVNRSAYLRKLCEFGTNTNIWDEAQIQNDSQKKERIRIGNNCWIRGYLLVYNHGGQIKIGNDSFIGPGTRIWSAKSIIIGSRVLISHDVNIHDNNSHPLDSSKRHEDFRHIIAKGLQDNIDLHEKEIIIEDDVWIGFNCTILKGVKIGKGAIIGSNTIISKDVEPYSVMVGNPARVIKYTT